MRALFLTAPRSFEYREAESAETPPGWVRVRMRYVGICGSDVHYYAEGRIGDQEVKYPFILGHEGSGEASEGAGHFERGSRVYIEPAISCHRCDQCLAGRENTCRNLRFLGNPLELSGCMQEEISMPPDCIVPLPEWLRMEDAVLLEPLCIGVYAVERSAAREGCHTAIVGAGPIGLSVLLGLSEVAPRQILVSEPVLARRAAAEKLGASQSFATPEGGAASAIWEASEGGVDVAFECAGTQDSIDDATRMLKPGGMLVLIGIPEGMDRVSYDPHLMRRREITVVNIRRQNKNIQRALALMKRRPDTAAVLITHCFGPERAAEAFNLVHQRADHAIKVLLRF